MEQQPQAAIRRISPVEGNPSLSPLLERCDNYNVGRFIETPDVEIVKRVYMQVRGLDESEVNVALHNAIQQFGERHHQLRSLWREHALRIADVLPEITALDERRRDLVGAYFTMEYSLASAALFNPSIAFHPRHTDAEEPDAEETVRRRILLTLRAVGEGHVSSILFREGWLEPNGSLTLDVVNPPWTPYSLMEDPFADEASASECGLKHEAAATFDDLGRLVQPEQSEASPPLQYEVTVPRGVPLSQCVFLPVQKSEKNGMEDLRMVEFCDNGKSIYYGTYTAYNGRNYWPQMIETEDFRRITVGNALAV